MATSSWPPTQFHEPLESFATSTGVARVRTDAGDVFVKALGNREGPPALIREYIGTRLAEWFGLPVFEYALMQVARDDDIPLGHGLSAQPGAAFVTRAYRRAFEWSGREDELDRVVNPEAITRLVVFDTWIVNPDRCPPQGRRRRPNYDNVFFAPQEDLPGRVRLIAMDFSLCLYLERRTELSTDIAHQACVQDERVYGLYPAFARRLNGCHLSKAIQRLKELDERTVKEVVQGVPREWDMPREVRDAVAGFLLQRAAFVTRTLPCALRPWLERQDELPGTLP